MSSKIMVVPKWLEQNEQHQKGLLGTHSAETTGGKTNFALGVLMGNELKAINKQREKDAKVTPMVKLDDIDPDIKVSCHDIDVSLTYPTPKMQYFMDILIEEGVNLKLEKPVENIASKDLPSNIEVLCLNNHILFDVCNITGELQEYKLYRRELETLPGAEKAYTLLKLPDDTPEPLQMVFSYCDQKVAGHAFEYQQVDSVQYADMHQVKLLEGILYVNNVALDLPYKVDSFVLYSVDELYYSVNLKPIEYTPDSSVVEKDGIWKFSPNISLSIKDESAIASKAMSQKDQFCKRMYTIKNETDGAWLNVYQDTEFRFYVDDIGRSSMLNVSREYIIASVGNNGSYSIMINTPDDEDDFDKVFMDLDGNIVGLGMANPNVGRGMSTPYSLTNVDAGAGDLSIEVEFGRIFINEVECELPYSVTRAFLNGGGEIIIEVQLTQRS